MLPSLLLAALASTHDKLPFCTMPPLNHAVVLFGLGNKRTYKTDAHQLGRPGAAHLRGLAVNGNAWFPSYSIQPVGGASKSLVSGVIEGKVPTFNAGLERDAEAFESQYVLEQWRQYAADLRWAVEHGDEALAKRVHLYFPEHAQDVVVLKNDDGDNVAPAAQSIHVVIGAGVVRADNDQNNKIDSAIIAPDAVVHIHRRWHHAHGFIVAKAMQEWFANKGSNSGLAIHGQKPAGVACAVEPNTLPFGTMPPLNHAAVLFGLGNKRTYKTDAHQLGRPGASHLRGLAVNGNAWFPSYSIQPVGGPSKSLVSGVIEGKVPTFNAGLERDAEAFESQYVLEQWRQYAADLRSCVQNDDAGVRGRVHLYFPEHAQDVVVLKNDDGDNVAPAAQSIHVVIGAGVVRADNDQNNKIDSAIIAPDAVVHIHRRWHHAHGFIVAKAMQEWFANKGSNSGLAIHGQKPVGITCTKGDRL